MREYRDLEHELRLDRVELAFDRDALRRICEMDEVEFEAAYDMTRTQVAQRAPSDFYLYRDNGSDVLAVAHLDTVADAVDRACNFLDTSGGPVVYSRALDDRLGAYIILELLPALGITYDILLTVGEEDGQSTAAFFEPPKDKEYHRLIEFDRGGTDVVLYQYEDDDMIERVRNSGARVGDGIFSDISYMEHMEVKGANWGVGYRDYHGPRAHAYLDDTMMMVAYYLKFHDDQDGVYLPHEMAYEDTIMWGRGRSRSQSLWFLDDEEWDAYWDKDNESVDVDDDPDFIENPTSEQLAALENPAR